MIPAEKLDALLSRVAELEYRMSQNPDPQTYVRLSRDYAGLEPLAARTHGFRAAPVHISTRRRARLRAV